MPTHGTRVSVDYLPKAQARKLYSFAQEMEEHMLEARRVRELEEARASAGGITMQAPTGLPPSAHTSLPADDPTARLTKLKALLDADLIEQADSKKAEILADL